MTNDTFSYLDFLVSDDRKSASFSYLLDHGGQSVHFQEKLEFPLALSDGPAQNAALRALHLALGISYYKQFLPPSIVHPYQMSTEEAAFWNDIWRNGLGEFLYVNQLSPDKLAIFKAQGGKSFPVAPEGSQLADQALLGIGGGKDSVVAGELLRDCSMKVEGYVLATADQVGQAGAVAETMGIPLHIVNRYIDKQLFSVQKQSGAYRGHVPISLIFGLVGTLLAIVTGTKYVVVGNESSASIPQTTWDKLVVNHQWSKSLDFERKLQGYIHGNIDPGIAYFSAVRQLSSVGVAKIFSFYSSYYEVFTSDNSVFRVDPSKRPKGRWSIDSPKSLSSFILLAPWVGEADMLRIFGDNLLDQTGLDKLFRELTGVEGHPPLDCVGTVEEMILSVNLIAQQGKYSGSHLINLARSAGVITDRDWQSELKHLLTLQPDHVIPSALADKISNRLTQELDR